MSQLKQSRFNYITHTVAGGRLIFNSASGALLRLSKDAHQRFVHIANGSVAIDTNSELDRMFTDGGYLVELVKDEVAELRSKHWESRNRIGSWPITICPTFDCNFACDYCFEDKKPGKMTGSVQAEFLKVFGERLSGITSVSVTWFGGEPTLAWDVVQHLSQGMIDLCGQHGIPYRASMISNGFMLTPARVEELPSLQIGYVQISIDGDRDDHDVRRALKGGKPTFDRLMENLHAFVNTPVEVGIRINVDRRNVSGLPMLLERLSEHRLANHENISVNFAAIQPINTISGNAGDFAFSRSEFADLEPDLYHMAQSLSLARLTLPQAKVNGCIAIQQDGLVLMPDGSIYNCWEALGHERYCLGNILDGYPPDRTSSRYKFWMDWDPFSSESACLECAWLPACMGGCPLRTLDPESLTSREGQEQCVHIAQNADHLLELFAPVKDCQAAENEWIVRPDPEEARNCEVCEERSCRPKCDTKYVCNTQCGCLDASKCHCLDPSKCGCLSGGRSSVLGSNRTRRP